MVDTFYQYGSGPPPNVLLDKLDTRTGVVSPQHRSLYASTHTPVDTEEATYWPTK